MSPTVTNTPPYMPYLIEITAYNSAGEIVRRITSEPAIGPMSDIKYIIGGKDGKDLVLSGDDLQIVIEGLETKETIGKGASEFTWDIRNEQSQYVNNGVYYIKIQETDAYGHVNTVTKQVTVERSADELELNIYNSAGEIVRSIRQQSQVWTGSTIALIMPDALYLKPAGGNEIKVQYTSNPLDTIVWDGRNGAGRLVGGGSYEIQVIIKKNGVRIEVAKSVIIFTEDEQFIKEVKAYPNPLDLNAAGITFCWAQECPAGLPEGRMTVRVYNISGELVRSVESGLETGSVVMDLAGKKSALPPGLYTCRFDGMSFSGRTNRAFCKFVIIHGAK